MKKLLAELIIAVQSLQQRDLWDYFAIIAPLVLSVVAVWISISTAKKQNKIALFEMRYKTVSVLCFLLSVAKEVVNQKDKEIDDWTTLAMAMNTYKMSTAEASVEVDYSKLDSFYTHLTFEAGKVNCLFAEKETKQITDFLEEFHTFVSLVCKNKVTDESREKLKNTVLLLEKSKIMKKLDVSLKL